MLAFTIKRLIAGIVSLFILVSVAFFLTRMIPGSPFQTGTVSAEVQTAIETEYGLDKPIFQQYSNYLLNLLQGDLGLSLKKPGVTVLEVIERSWSITASLGGLSILVAMIVGTLFGIWQAISKNPFVRGGIFSLAMLGTAIPNFVIALLLMFVLGVKLKWFPIVGITEAANYVLPVLALSVYPTAVISKLVHRTFGDEMKKDYVVMAKAKGLKFWQIALTHVLRHAWIPVLNYIGPAAAFLLTGSFVVESIFTIPGLGREFVSSIGNRDYTLILGLTVFMGVVVIGVNLLTDLLCAWFDPKVRRECR